MNQKNIIIACLVLLCLLLFMGWQTGRTADQNRPISATEYSCLLSMRNILPPEKFEAEVLPLLQGAASGKPVTFGQLEIMNERLGDISQHVLAAAEKNSPQEKIASVWDEARQSATQLGEDVGREMTNMLDGLSGMFNNGAKQSPAPEPSTPQSPAPQTPQTGNSMTPVEL